MGSSPKELDGKNPLAEPVEVMRDNLVTLVQVMKKVDIHGPQAKLNKDKFFDNNGRLIHF